MNRLLIAVLIVVSSSLLYSCKEPDTESGAGGTSLVNAPPAAPPVAPPATPVDTQPADSGITLTSPNGGENWNVGETHTITWSSGSGGTLYIYLYKGGDYSETIASSTANDGSFNWTIPSSLATSSNYGIVIFSTENSDVYDLSNGDFTITAPISHSITVTSPNGGETWMHGENRTFTWDSNNLGGSVKIDLYKSGSYDGTVVSSTPNDGSFDWTILSSVTAGSDYKARVTSTTYPSVFDSSNSNFTIEGFSQSLTLTSPNGGESWTTGETKTISWSSSNVGSSVKIELYKSGSRVSTISSSTANDGSYSWSIPSSLAAGSDYKIMVIPTAYTHLSDVSNSFTIQAAEHQSGPAKVLSPNGGECYQLGDTLTVTWTGGLNSTSEIVEIKLHDVVENNGTDIAAQGWPNNTNQSYTWTVAYNWNGSFGESNSLTLGSDYKIMVRFGSFIDFTNPEYYRDWSDETFSILTSCP